MAVDLLQRLLDRQAITDVLHAYCRGVDMADPGGVAALFTDDCLVDYGPGFGEPIQGSALLRDRLDRGMPRFAATSHHVSNIEIKFDEPGDEPGDATGDEPGDGSGRSTSATAVTYLHAWHRYPDERPDAVLWARYHDRFVRSGERWLIAERTLRVAGQQEFDVEWHPIGRR